MRRTRAGWLVAALSAIAVADTAGRPVGPPVRLTEISGRAEAGRFAVLIRTSDPVAYAAAQPDPLGVIVELRHATTDGVVNRLAGRSAPVRVRVEAARAPDGTPLGRVHLRLATPARYRVRSNRTLIRVEFERLGQSAEGMRPAAAEASDTRTTGRPWDGPAAGPQPAVAAAAAGATTLRAVRTVAGPEGVVVTLSGDGPLVPGAVTEAQDPPPRLVLDLPAVTPAIAAVTAVHVGPVERIRVAANSRRPLVTRVVIDLARPTSYRVEPPDGDVRDLRIIFPVDPGLSVPAAATSGPTAAGPARAATVVLDPMAALRLVDGPPAAAALLLDQQPTKTVDTSGNPGTTIPPQRASPPPRPLDTAVAAANSVAGSLLPVEGGGGQEAVRTGPDRPSTSTATPAAGLGESRRGEATPVAASGTEPTAAGRPPSAPAVTTVPVVADATLEASGPNDPGPASSQPPAQPVQPPPQPLPPGTPPPGSPPQPPTRPETQVAPGQRQYTGFPISLDFQSADLRSVLRTFAEITGLNIVIDPAVQGTVDVALRDVPWDQALEIILRANKLGYIVDGTVVRIAPLTVLAEEEAQRRKLAEEQALAGQLHVLTRTLSYARATELRELLTRTVLSQRGQVQVDERTNTLIITDLQERLTSADDLIRTLDRPEPQVEIEARIVQTTRDFARALGVQWGLNGRVAPDLGNTTPLAFPNRGTVSGRTGTQGPVDPRATSVEQTGTAVNLPVQGATNAIGLALGAVNGAFNLDVALSALERQGRGRILSAPRVTTQNNVAAEMTQGVQIPIQTVANNTVTVTFKDAALTLRVTPQITAANTIVMNIALENAAPDFSRQVGGIPPIDTQRANTTVQVNDGQTTVIGGIFVSREQSVSDRTPGLHRLPLIGWLFRREDVRDESRELLIFITPRIIR